jgi:predicted ATPase/class 3 adenylate cyclase
MRSTAAYSSVASLRQDGGQRDLIAEVPVSDLPTGIVTFLFTDIEGSTRLVQQLGADEYQRLLTEHSDLLRNAVHEAGGQEFGSEGDAHFFVFGRASGAVRAAAAGQRALAAHDWRPEATIRVRMGIHTGAPARHGQNYVGVDLNRVARLTAAGHGGQVLLSEDARDAAGDDLGADVGSTDLGRHRLKDLAEPERIFQLVAPGLAADFPPIRTIDTRPKRLPAQLTSFIGRTRELAELVELASRARLATLTGPGGSGKTRLAIAAADRLLPRFDDGVFFVPLAPLHDPEMVPEAIAAVLDLHETPERPIREMLKEGLRDKRSLIIMDNFEHLIAASPFVGDLLEGSPDVSVMVTSRELLHVYGEQEYPVAPLPVPAADLPTGAATGNACVQLFVDRATAVSSDFRLTEENLATIAEICRRVDGLPLAVELAAAWTRILSPADVLARLKRRLAGLTGGARDLPERQRTLRAAIDWSHELLDSEERRLFARLSVFAGGWTREAAEAIGAGDLATEVLDALGSLVDKSLVRREVGAAGGIRFGMLETIREYAGERLGEAGEASSVHGLHASYFRTLAESAEPNLTGPDASRWLATLGDEVPNLRAALAWALAADDPAQLEVGLFTSGALWRFWQQTGTLREAADWLARLLAAATAPELRAARAKALRGAGGIAYWQQDLPLARASYEEAVAIYRQLGDPVGLAPAVSDLAYLPMLTGDTATARVLFMEARDLFRDNGDAWNAALSELGVATTRYFEGSHAEARESFLSVLPVIRERGDRFWLLEAMTGIGQVDRMMGNLDQARRELTEALQVAVDSGILPSVAMVLDPLSNLEATAGDHERAVRLWAASASIKEQVGGGAPPEIMQVVDPRPAAIEAIGADAVAAAWAEGWQMGPEKAFAYAVGPVKESAHSS